MRRAPDSASQSPVSAVIGRAPVVRLPLRLPRSGVPGGARRPPPPGSCDQDGRARGPGLRSPGDALYFTTVPRPRAVRRPARWPPAHGARRPPLPPRVGARDHRPARRERRQRHGARARGPPGRLRAGQLGARAIARVDRATGERETLVDDWRGVPLNSPNDVVVKTRRHDLVHGPELRVAPGFPAAARCVGTPCSDTTRERASAIVVADSFDKPNGLCFSPDERTLYVTDNGEPHHLKAFDVLDGGRLDRERVIHVTSPEHPDGLKADSAGRLYATFAGGVAGAESGWLAARRDRAARRRQLLLRRPRPQRPLHHRRHGDLRRPPQAKGA